MPTFIRLTDYRDSDTKEQQFTNPSNRHIANQNDFSKIPGSPIAYWVSDRVKEIFEKSKKIKDFSIPKQGMATSDNNRFLKFWNEVDLAKIGLLYPNREEAKLSGLKWFPYNKGGETRKWYGNFEYVVNWENDGKEIKDFRDYKNSTLSSNMGVAGLTDIFKHSVSWSKVSTSGLALRYYPQGCLFDVAGCCIFSTNANNIYFMSLLNSKLESPLISSISPTVNFEAGQLAEVPIIFSNSDQIRQTIDTLTQQNIDISKEEWDSRETSWDFCVNELIRHKTDDGKISSAYQTYCDCWREKFMQLHANEVELNRLFIDIYELQDELTPDVDLGDITILKQESKIVDGELVFQADEIMKQFVSYGVGCMFGRYSLDQEGLVVANMGQEIPASCTFEIDADNVIPVLEDDYFTDDIASRFIEFVKVAFGADHHAENIRFIEDALGTTIRKYFVKGFYEDHIKRYKKRPIYWMVSSPKKSFNALIYMHRYQDDIFARIQNNYLREYISKLEASSHTATTIANDESNSSADRKKAIKEIDDIAKKLDEIIKFDRDKLTQFAQSRTPIDLDDGVKVNYCKFEEILYPISGLCK
jgi:hypothetical protein